MDFGNMPLSAADRVGSALEGREHHETMLHFHLDYLDDYCVGVGKNDLVLLGAATGCGKTALAKTIAQRNVEEGKTCTYFALEAEQGEIEVRLAYELILGLASRAGTSLTGVNYARWHCRMHPELIKYEDSAESEVREKYKNLHTFYKRGDFTQQDLKKEFYAAHAESDLLVLDHLHYVDTQDNNENRAYKDLVKTVRDLALECDTPIICVAHLRKRNTGAVRRVVPDIEDFHGSSDLIKIATKCVVFAPAYDQEMPYGLAPTYVHVAKDRRVGTSRFVGLCAYDLRETTYRPGYQLGRISSVGDKWEETKFMQLPSWSERAIRPELRV